MPLAGSVIFVGMLRIVPPLWSLALQLLGGCLLIYALFTQYGGMLKRRGAPLVLGTVLLEGLFVFGGLSYLASSLTDRFGINYAYAGLMVAGFGVGGLVYSVSVKRLIGRVGELGILLLGGALLGVAFVSVGLMPSWHWFVPTVIVLGMGYYTMHGTLQTKATELAPEARGTAVSLFAFFFFMGQATGPQLLGSVLKSRGYGAAFIVAGVGLLTTAVVSRALFARARRQANDARIRRGGGRQLNPSCRSRSDRAQAAGGVFSGVRAGSESLTRSGPLVLSSTNRGGDPRPYTLGATVPMRLSRTSSAPFLLSDTIERPVPRARRAAILLCLAIVLQASLGAQAPVLRWGGDAEGGAPYVEADPNNPQNVSGFDVEIAALDCPVDGPNAAVPPGGFRFTGSVRDPRRLRHRLERDRRHAGTARRGGGVAFPITGFAKC